MIFFELQYIIGEICDNVSQFFTNLYVRHPSSPKPKPKEDSPKIIRIKNDLAKNIRLTKQKREKIKAALNKTIIPPKKPTPTATIIPIKIKTITRSDTNSSPRLFESITIIEEDIENPTIKISLLDRDVECELEAAQHIGAINVMLSNMDRERWTTETIPLKKVDYIQYCLILHWISKPHTSSNDEEIDDIVQWELNFLDEISQKYPERFLRLIKLANYLDIPTLYTATTAHAAYMLTQCKPDAIPAAMSQEKLQSFTRKLPFEHDDDDDD
ncbi:uncharacterized protein LOC116349741 isoform X1 [Contarinia nasturtii]|uniref:uncharacterized protein LOC116349741 isoform X1 n=1 Tax=Contarinia nasturtii TaxID=265458 RepID=UPI0012D3B74B|nr:uncharacterized protein LOC116349741 isoform X1 [Contarinia nasturtii]